MCAQAVNSADFALGQFRFLRGLMLTHGRQNYRRFAIFAFYMFYINAAMVMSNFFYSMLATASGDAAGRIVSWRPQGLPNGAPRPPRWLPGDPPLASPWLPRWLPNGSPRALQWRPKASPVASHWLLHGFPGTSPMAPQGLPTRDRCS